MIKAVENVNSFPEVAGAARFVQSGNPGGAPGGDGVIHCWELDGVYPYFQILGGEGGTASSTSCEANFSVIFSPYSARSAWRLVG